MRTFFDSLTPHSIYLAGHKWLFVFFLLDNSVILMSCLLISIGLLAIGLRMRMHFRLLFLEFSALFLALSFTRGARIGVILTGRHYQPSSVLNDLAAVISAVVCVSFLSSVPDIMAFFKERDVIRERNESYLDTGQKIVASSYLQSILQKNAEGMLRDDARLRTSI